MPNKPKTVAHTVRVEPELWAASIARSKIKQESVSDVVRRALKAYTRGTK